MGNYFLDHVQQLYTTETRVPLTGYTGSTDMVFDVRGMDRKGLLIKNAGPTGSTAGIEYSVLASVDGGVEYDISHLAGATLAAAGQTFIEFSNNYTHAKVRVLSAGATTVVVKHIASSN
jgi:hypothetical protein